MCWCSPALRTPHCGRFACQPPGPALKPAGNTSALTPSDLKDAGVVVFETRHKAGLSISVYVEAHGRAASREDFDNFGDAQAWALDFARGAGELAQCA